MAVMVNCSDLAAVGAHPLALLVAETFDQQWREDQIAALQRGIADAARVCGIGIAGGDTNFGERTAVTGTALGLCGPHGAITRRGAEPGHALYVSGNCGLGSAFAASMLLRGERVSYRLSTALREGALLPGLASSCMDSSDGLFPTIDELMRVNGCGFSLDRDPRTYLHPSALAAADELQLPGWAMLCGPHGDFNLVFTVSPERIDAFEQTASSAYWSPHRIGCVTDGHFLECAWTEIPFRCDVAAFRSAVFASADARDILSILHRFCHSQSEGVLS